MNAHPAQRNYLERRHLQGQVLIAIAPLSMLLMHCLLLVAQIDHSTAHRERGLWMPVFYDPPCRRPKEVIDPNVQNSEVAYIQEGVRLRLRAYALLRSSHKPHHLPNTPLIVLDAQPPQRFQYGLDHYRRSCFHLLAKQH